MAALQWWKVGDIPREMKDDSEKEGVLRNEMKRYGTKNTL